MEKIAIILWGMGIIKSRLDRDWNMWIFMRCSFAINLADNFILND